MLILFYKAFIQSMLTFCIQCWGGALSVQNKNKLDGVIKVGGKITGEPVNSITILSEQYSVSLAHKIIADPLHPLWSEYALLPQGEGTAHPGCGQLEASHPLSHAASSCLTSSEHMDLN